MLLTTCNSSLLSILLLLPFAQASPMKSHQSEILQFPLAPSVSSPTDLASSTYSSLLPNAVPSSSSSSGNSTSAELLPRDASPDPQSTCEPNSGTDNTGCGNSGISNSGTGNSGICLSGTGESGVGDCSAVAEAVGTTTFVLGAATTVYLIQTVTIESALALTTVQSVIAAGATATQTIVVDDGRYNRPGCAYWRTQGYTCSGAGRVRGFERWMFWPVVMGVMGAALVL